MSLKKHITAFLVLQMFAMQLLLAQHYTVHFNEEQHVAVSQQQPANHAPAEHGKADPDKVCQICIFSKAFSQTIYAASIDIPVAVVATESVTRVLHSALAQNTTLVYSARAPPPFLS